MALSEEFVAGISEAAESVVAEAESDVAGTAGQVDAGDTGEESDADERTADSKSGEEGSTSDDGRNEGSAVSESEESADGEDESSVRSAESTESTESTESVTKPEVPVVQRSNSIVERAVRAGLPLDDARSFPSDASLERATSLLEQSQVSVESGDGEPDLLEQLENLNPDQYEPEAIALFGGLAQEMRAQREQLKAIVDGQAQAAQAGMDTAAREVEQWFDGQVAQLGEDFSETLGTGAHSSLDRGSSQFAKREEIAEKASVILAGLHATGRPVPPRDEIFKQAAGLVLQDEFATVRERNLKESLRKRGKQHISRAGRREEQPSTESPVDATVAALTRKFPNA